MKAESGDETAEPIHERTPARAADLTRKSCRGFIVPFEGMKSQVSANVEIRENMHIPSIRRKRCVQRFRVADGFGECAFGVADETTKPVCGSHLRLCTVTICEHAPRVQGWHGTVEDAGKPGERARQANSAGVVDAMPRLTRRCGGARSWRCASRKRRDAWQLARASQRPHRQGHTHGGCGATWLFVGDAASGGDGRVDRRDTGA
ncbi:hypothetical protein C8R45DRAFT_348094 [Mycena sanguinolenta]|nr:hypothetical protein C8R45DRAFT_348094 [Mycena sanguinolenta]